MIPVAVTLGIEAAKVLLPAALDIIEAVKARGELTPEQQERLEKLNTKTEKDYVREAGGKE